MTTSYGMTSSAPYATWATLTENGKSRTAYTDGLGRLIRVVEDPNSLNYQTTYAYDAADNLHQVTQGSQTRTFTYDNLGRLLTASNPEYGTSGGSMVYTYDANGNLETRTDGRWTSAAVTMAYDALNRLSTKTLHGGAVSRFCYDGLTYSSSGCSGSTSTAELGYLTGVGNAVSSTNYKHGRLGLVAWSQQTTDGQSYAFQNPSTPGSGGYVYNDAGQLTSIYYPSGRTLTYGYDGAGRVNSVNGYVTSVSYAPHGAPTSVALANGVTEATGYNERLQPQSIDATKSGLLWKLENFYCASQDLSCASNNGNVISQRLTAGAWTLTSAYGYDNVNRLDSAVENGATPVNRTYDYDQYGNMTMSGTGAAPSGQACSSYDEATNRCSNAGWGYDEAGNLTAMAYGTASWSMGYNAENMQTSLTEAGSTWQYFYDGEGRRVKKTNGAQTVVYVYDATGQLAAEYDTTIQAADCGRCYLTADPLGSTRLVTDETGQVKKRYDYEPFGWEIGSSWSGRGSVAGYANGDETNPKFTGKERDYETTASLDYFGARYFSGAQGRFTSPDEPLLDQDPADPQSWNLFSYVRNNPLKFVDPTGNGCAYLNRSRTEFVDFNNEINYDKCEASRGYWVNGIVTQARIVNRYLILTGTTDGKNSTFAAYPLEDPDPGLMALQRGTQMAEPWVNAAGEGLMLFASFVAPEAMLLADCGAGDCSMTGVAMAMIPGSGGGKTGRKVNEKAYEAAKESVDLLRRVLKRVKETPNKTPATREAQRIVEGRLKDALERLRKSEPHGVRGQGPRR